MKIGISMQNFAASVSFSYTKLANHTFSSLSVNLLQSNTLISHVICMKTCNLVAQCTLVSYTRDAKVCCLYSSPKNDLVYSTTTDVFTKNLNAITSTSSTTRTSKAIDRSIHVCFLLILLNDIVLFKVSTSTMSTTATLNSCLAYCN